LECERSYIVTEYIIYCRSSRIPCYNQLLTSLLQGQTS
jgi:hypothetical protein